MNPSLFPQRKGDNEHSQILLQSHLQASVAKSLGPNVGAAPLQPSCGQGTTGARHSQSKERGSSPPRTDALLVYRSSLVPQSKPFPRSQNDAARKRPEILTCIVTISPPFYTYTCNLKTTTCKGSRDYFFLCPFLPGPRTPERFPVGPQGNPLLPSIKPEHPLASTEVAYLLGGKQTISEA